MKTEFCPHCGAKHSYAAAAPKFCSSCGGGLASATASSTASVDSPQEESAASSSEESVPQITKLQYSVEVAPRNPVKIGDLIKEGPTENAAPFERHTSNASSEEHLEECKRECQSSRGAAEVGE